MTLVDADGDVSPVRAAAPAQDARQCVDPVTAVALLRIHPSGRKVRIVQTRIEGRSRRLVIARRGVGNRQTRPSDRTDQDMTDREIRPTEWAIRCTLDVYRISRHLEAK